MGFSENPLDHRGPDVWVGVPPRGRELFRNDRRFNGAIHLSHNKSSALAIAIFLGGVVLGETAPVVEFSVPEEKETVNDQGVVTLAWTGREAGERTVFELQQSGDFFRLRFGNMAWYIFLSISMTYSMAWLVTMAIAGGELVNALSGIDYAAGLTVILLVCIGYTLFGGLFAVIGTDFIQSVIILVGIVVIGFAVLTKTDIPEMAANLKSEQPAVVSIFMRVALLAVFNKKRIADSSLPIRMFRRNWITRKPSISSCRQSLRA